MNQNAAPSSRFELGCNYWPRRSGMYMWRELDLGEVRADFAHMRAIGFRVVRFFLLTEDFLPAPLTVAADKVGQLVEIARIASEEKIATIPTLVTINMSGKMWWPSWMLDQRGAPRGLYSDPALLRSQARLVETCARALAGERSIRAFDLTNEIDDALRLPSRDAGWLWTALLAGSVRRAAPGKAVQFGAHLPSLTANTHMRIDDLASIVDEDCMHAYPLYCDVARSFLDPELVPFSCALTADLAATGRAPLMHEFGICTAPQGSPGITITDDFLGRSLSQYLASEEEGARYYEQVLERLAATGAAGAYAWCYGDYDATLFGRPPFDKAIRERSFGLVRADGSEKPAAEVVRAFAARLARGDVALGRAPKVLDVTVDAYYAEPQRHFRRLYERWVTVLPPEDGDSETYRSSRDYKQSSPR
jgi:endo-1,4-beta-mannosidase